MRLIRVRAVCASDSCFRNLTPAVSHLQHDLGWLMLSGMIQATNPFAMASLAFDCWQLWFESSQVIALRTMRLMQGGALAQREAVRMVSEKWEAATYVGFCSMTGQGGDTPEAIAQRAVRHYRTRVSANRRRLTGR